MIMKNINEPKNEFVNKILSVISLEKGLSENTIMAYKKDVCQVFQWFKKNDINFLNIIDHDQNDDPINIIITILTVIVARPKSAQKVKASFSILSAHLFAIFGLA